MSVRFFGKNLESADEWCVLIESNKLSLVVYGQEWSPDNSRYQCAGSMDTELVNNLLPNYYLNCSWQTQWKATD